MPKLKQRNDGYFRTWYKGKQFLGKTQAEAEAKRDAYKYECEHGIERIESITLFDFVARWLPVAKANVNRNTYNHYAHLMEILTDICGEKQISAVKPSDIKLAWKEMIGRSHSYIQAAHHLYLFDLGFVDHVRQIALEDLPVRHSSPFSFNLRSVRSKICIMVV